jgi:hypothetical protein
LLTERFRLTTKRLISLFTVTRDYLIAFEIDTKLLTLHTHHGALLIRLSFPYQPSMMIRSNFCNKNQLWTCSEHTRQCHSMDVNHRTKKTIILDQIDFQVPIGNVNVYPVGISCDEKKRVAIHDTSMSTPDRLLLFDNSQNRIIPLDVIKDHDRSLSARIERILLVPKQAHLVILVYTPQLTTSSANEIIILDITHEPAKILGRLLEPNGVLNIDLTFHGEFVYTSRRSASKRIPSNMHIYQFIDDNTNLFD